ncbi:MAG: hypothetical protein EOO39_40765 [Cytophagaceae bacterium]|nr:MAG: hypothetical protein EOO39_40765 [Cytophagaceae bacterium]
MTTTRLYVIFVSLFMIAELLGCKDHLFIVTPGADRLRVKTITQQVAGGASVNTVNAFSYNGQGRLSSILAYQSPDSTVAPVENTTYQYDTQNRLIRVLHSQVRRGLNSETYTLTYNTAGQLSGLGNAPSTFNLSLQYNSANQVSSYSRSIGVGGLRSTGGGLLTFAGNNLTSASENFNVYASGGSPTAPPVYGRVTNTTYTFDDKLNPFYGVFIIPAPGVFLAFPSSPGALSPFYILYGGIDNTLNLSQNNVLSAVNSSGTTTLYTYTYNAANLPVSRTTTINSATTEVLRFDYESY